MLFVVLLGFLGRYRFPFRLPVGLVAIGLGVFLGIFTGDTTINFHGTGLYPPVPVFGNLLIGLRLIWSKPELFAVLIPIEIYNFFESIGNVKSAQTAGDNYNMRTSLWVDGLGTCIGALFGSPFPTTIYLGHPAYKQMGARTSYTITTGLLLWFASLIGLFAFLLSLVGLIHAGQIGLSFSPITMGYLCLTVLFGIFHWVQPNRQEPGEIPVK